MANVSDLGRELLYRFEATQDVLIEDGGRNYTHLDFLIVGKHPEYPNHRSLIQFEDPVLADGHRMKWARMYLHYFFAHKPSWHSLQETPSITRTIQVNQVKKRWVEDQATSLFRESGQLWSKQFLGFDGDDPDADARPLDAVALYSGKPYGFVEFDITEAVRNWQNEDPNYGLLLWATNEYVEGKDRRFHSHRAKEEFRPFVNILCDKAN